MPKITLGDIFDILDEAEAEQQNVMQPQTPQVQRPEELRYENQAKEQKKKDRKDKTNKDMKITPKDDNNEEPRGEDVSATGKFKAGMTIKWDIKDDNSNNPIGENGETHNVIDEENHDKMATYFFDKIVKDLDIDFFKEIKKDTTLKFYLDANFTIESANEEKNLKIYFDIKDNDFVVVGWSFNVDNVSDGKLDGLNEKLEALFKSLFPSFEK